MLYPSITHFKQYWPRSADWSGSSLCVMPASNTRYCCWVANRVDTIRCRLINGVTDISLHYLRWPKVSFDTAWPIKWFFKPSIYFFLVYCDDMGFSLFLHASSMTIFSNTCFSGNTSGYQSQRASGSQSVFQVDYPSVKYSHKNQPPIYHLDLCPTCSPCSLALHSLHHKVWHQRHYHKQ